MVADSGHEVVLRYLALASAATSPLAAVRQPGALQPAVAIGPSAFSVTGKTFGDQDSAPGLA